MIIRLFYLLFTFINELVFSLFLLKLDPKDFIEFLNASVVGEFTSNYYFY